jgi:zinc transporter ZupT
MIILTAIVASVAAFLGGAIALKFKDKLHLMLGLSAGAVVGAALFDLMPESIELGSSIFSPGTMTAITACGFMLYLVLDRIFSFHCGEADACEHDHGHSSAAGSFGAASFCLHSLIDGMAIGLSFQVSASIGAVVAVAVIAHRFSDGINTVGVILKHRGEDRRAMIWLSAVAVAPIIGAALTFAISVSDQALAVILAVFAGFFLYIGASDLIPEGHHSHSKYLTTAMTLLGAAMLYTVVHI